MFDIGSLDFDTETQRFRSSEDDNDKTLFCNDNRDGGETEDGNIFAVL